MIDIRRQGVVVNDMDLEVTHDAAGNHDGAMGVVMGLAAIRVLQAEGSMPQRARPDAY